MKDFLMIFGSSHSLFLFLKFLSLALLWQLRALFSSVAGRFNPVGTTTKERLGGVGVEANYNTAGHF